MDEGSGPQATEANGEPSMAVNGGDNTSQLAQLDDLKAQAQLKYSVKDYNAAAELYSQATELQAELNGEMSSRNAELLYNYGKCLYQVAVKKSDVLGSKVAGEKREDGPSKPKVKKQIKAAETVQTNGDTDHRRKVDEEIITQVVEEKEGSVAAGIDAQTESKPYFQFTGDENFDDSEDEEDDEDGEEDEAEAEDEEDDFANAYEILDLARVLLRKRIDEEKAGEGKGKATREPAAVRHLKELLADTHDLQAEISLEGERFPNAVVDIKESLALKESFLPFEHSHIAEVHFKLSLALEFSSVTQQKDEGAEVADGGQAHIDEAMREEAAKEMETAIASCKLRIEKEQASLDGSPTPLTTGHKGKITKEHIDDAKDMVKDMEQRLVELRQPPVSINDPTSTGTVDGSNPLSGILGSILGESPAAQKARLEEASRQATDLTDLVKRKKGSAVPSPQPAADNTPNVTNGKRKVEFDEEVVEVGTGKKARLEDGVEDS